jgi:tungstate transport system substrate-binding protein
VRSRVAALGATALVSLLILAACGSLLPETTQPRSASRPSPLNANVLLATTTSTQDSGLLDVLIPDFEAETGYKVKSTAVGTGAALALGTRGEADVLFVHAPSAELEFMRTGAGDQRILIMHNDFVLVGPPGDGASIRGRSPLDAFRAIATARTTFISRADGSGTDLLEKELWRDAAVVPGGAWYVEAGTGMGQTLRIASERRAYTLTDRATYLANRENLVLEVLVKGDAKLRNVYHVITVSQARFPQVNAAGGRAFAEYLGSARAQRLIADFGVDRFGQPLFFADAGRREEDLR